VLVSFAYVIACGVFAFVLLLARSDRSKELEILCCATSCRSCGGRRALLGLIQP
jgi:hypothetical protein